MNKKPRVVRAITPGCCSTRGKGGRTVKPNRILFLGKLAGAMGRNTRCPMGGIVIKRSVEKFALYAMLASFSEVVFHNYYSIFQNLKSFSFLLLRVRRV